MIFRILFDVFILKSLLGFYISENLEILLKLEKIIDFLFMYFPFVGFCVFV